MPKTVDKQKKRQNIALSSTELFCKKGFHNLTVSEVAHNAKIAKGTIYEYFKNKEDIVFAIIEYEQVIYDKEIEKNIKNTTNIENKILALFDLCIDESPVGIQRRKMYKEFILICLDSPNQDIIDFQNNIKSKYTLWLKEIIAEGIKENKLKTESLEFTNGLFAMAEGVLIFSHFENYNEKNILKTYIQSLLKLIKTED